MIRDKRTRGPERVDQSLRLCDGWHARRAGECEGTRTSQRMRESVTVILLAVKILIATTKSAITEESARTGESKLGARMRERRERGKRESKGVRTTTRMSVTITVAAFAIVNTRTGLGLRLCDGQ